MLNNDASLIKHLTVDMQIIKFSLCTDKASFAKSDFLKSFSQSILISSTFMIYSTLYIVQM